MEHANHSLTSTHCSDLSIPHAGELFMELAHENQSLNLWKKALVAPPNANKQLIELPPTTSTAGLSSVLSSPSKWVGECRSLAAEVMGQIRELPEWVAHEEGQKALADLLESGVVEEMSGPEEFRDTVAGILRDFKEYVSEEGGRRSKVAFYFDSADSTQKRKNNFRHSNFCSNSRPNCSPNPSLSAPSSTGWLTPLLLLVEEPSVVEENPEQLRSTPR
jgi:hypothetical protein